MAEQSPHHHKPQREAPAVCDISDSEQSRCSHAGVERSSYGGWQLSEAEEWVVRVSLPNVGDAEELSSQVRGLQQELLQLDVQAVDIPTESDAPQGSKGFGAVTGTLLVRLGVRTGARAVVAAVRKWASRDAIRSVELTFGDNGDVLKVTGVSSERQEQLIEVWLERQSART